MLADPSEVPLGAGVNVVEGEINVPSDTTPTPGTVVPAGSTNCRDRLASAVGNGSDENGAIVSVSSNATSSVAEIAMWPSNDSSSSSWSTRQPDGAAVVEATKSHRLPERGDVVTEATITAESLPLAVRGVVVGLAFQSVALMTKFTSRGVGIAAPVLRASTLPACAIAAATGAALCIKTPRISAPSAEVDALGVAAISANVDGPPINVDRCASFAAAVNSSLTGTLHCTKLGTDDRDIRERSTFVGVATVTLSASSGRCNRTRCGDDSADAAPRSNER